jgi:hypothetical protein
LPSLLGGFHDDAETTKYTSGMDVSNLLEMAQL